MEALRASLGRRQRQGAPAAPAQAEAGQRRCRGRRDSGEGAQAREAGAEGRSRRSGRHPGAREEGRDVRASAQAFFRSADPGDAGPLARRHRSVWSTPASSRRGAGRATSIDSASATRAAAHRRRAAARRRSRPEDPRRAAQARASLPAEMPLTGLRITAVGNDVTVKEGGAQWQAESGQRVMDFEVDAETGQASPSCSHVAGSAARELDLEETNQDASDPAARCGSRVFSRWEALETRDPSGAEAAYRMALAIDPGFRRRVAQSRRAAVRSAPLRRGGGALRCRGPRLNPGEALLHFNRAIALEDQGRLRGRARPATTPACGSIRTWPTRTSMPPACTSSSAMPRRRCAT